MLDLPADGYYGDRQKAKSKVMTNRMHSVHIAASSEPPWTFYVELPLLLCDQSFPHQIF